VLPAVGQPQHQPLRHLAIARFQVQQLLEERHRQLRHGQPLQAPLPQRRRPPPGAAPAAAAAVRFWRTAECLISTHGTLLSACLRPLTSLMSCGLLAVSALRGRRPQVAQHQLPAAPLAPAHQHGSAQVRLPVLLRQQRRRPRRRNRHLHRVGRLALFQAHQPQLVARTSTRSSLRSTESPAQSAS